MTAIPPHDTFTFDGWTLTTMPRELTRGGQRVPLQDQPLQILEALVTHPHQLVTREQLVARLWPRGVVDFDGSLNTAMRKLRAALGDDADTPRYIETLPRQGYRFVGTLTPRAPPEPAAPAATPIARTMRLWLWAGAIAALLSAAFFLLRPDAAASRPRIGVLPFENLSPDAEVAFFTDGLHEEILGTLAARAPNLDVISRTTMMTYRDTGKSVPEIAAELALSQCSKVPCAAKVARCGSRSSSSMHERIRNCGLATTIASSLAR